MFEPRRLCPDCKGLIYWDSRMQAYRHDIIDDCAYMENLNGKRIWDNNKRDERRKKLQEGKAKIRLLTGDIIEEEIDEETFSI